MREKVGEIYYDITADTSGLIGQTRVVERETERMAASFSAIVRAVKALAAALAALKLAEMADEIRLLQARVEVAAGSVDKGSEAFKRLVRQSRDTQTSLAGNIEVFNRLNQSILQMGGTQEDTLRVTELLGKAIKVSGASAEESKSAMIQFGQALGSGKLQGDELRSLLENAPYLMQQLAAGIGVPVGALRKLGEEGKLTSDVVVNALSKAAGKIEADFKKFPQTIGGAMQVARDAAALAALQYDELTGGSRALAGATKGLAEVLDELASQFQSANDEAGKLSRNDAIKGWADTTKTALSYLVDAADLTWQTFSVLGRNVSFVFKAIGSEIGGQAALAVAYAKRDFAAVRDIRQQMKADSEKRRKELDDADQKTLGRAMLAGEKMRQAWAAPQADYSNEGRVTSGPSKLKTPADDDAVRKLKAKAESAQAYLQGLVSDNSLALDRIDAEEKKALADNLKRQAEDKNNAEVYAKARVEITKKYARERGLVEERTNQQIADFNISTTADEVDRISAMRDEAFRRADAQVKLGVITAAEGERAKAAAMVAARESFDDLAERNARARADRELAITKDESRQIELIRDEAIRQAQDGYERGKITFDEMEQAKTKALQDAEDKRLALRNRAQQTRIETLQIRAQTTDSATDKEALIRAQAQAALDAAEQARQRDLANEQLYADQKVAIVQRMNMQLMDLQAATDTAMFAMVQSSAGQVLDVLRRAGKERTAIGKALFLAERALAVATIIVNTEVGAAKAVGTMGPFGIPLASLIRATGYASAGLVAGLAVADAFGGGRQYGGPVSAGSLYRVNETGRPEMFTAANGSQYMLPTKGGSVTPADKVGGSAAPVVIIENHGAPLQVQSQTFDQQTNTIRLAVAAVAEQISNNNGPVWSAMRGATNVQSRL